MIRLKLLAQLRDGERLTVVEYRGREYRQLLESTELVGPFFRALFYGDAPCGNLPPSILNEEQIWTERGVSCPPSTAECTGSSVLTPLLKDVPGWRRGDSAGATAQEDATYGGKRTHLAVHRICIECFYQDGRATVSEYHRRYKIDDIMNESEETVGEFFRAHVGALP